MELRSECVPVPQSIHLGNVLGRNSSELSVYSRRHRFLLNTHHPLFLPFSGLPPSRCGCHSCSALTSHQRGVEVRTGAGGGVSLCSMRCPPGPDTLSPGVCLGGLSPRQSLPWKGWGITVTVAPPPGLPGGHPRSRQDQQQRPPLLAGRVLD